MLSTVHKIFMVIKWYLPLLLKRVYETDVFLQYTTETK